MDSPSAQTEATALAQYMVTLQAENEVLRQQVSMLSASLQQAEEFQKTQKAVTSWTHPPPSLGAVRLPPGLELESPVAAAEVANASGLETRFSRCNSDAEPEPAPEPGQVQALEPVAREQFGTFRATPVAEAATSSTASPEHPVALQVFAATLNGDVACTRVEWRVEHVRAKLRASCGFPLVSPSFDVLGIPPLRLMFVPGERWVASTKCGSQQRKRSSGTHGGSAYGTLKLKAGNVEGGAAVTLYLTLGEMRLGPLTCDFGERVVHCCDLAEDWSSHIKPEGDQLCFGVDILA